MGPEKISWNRGYWLVRPGWKRWPPCWYIQTLTCPDLPFTNNKGRVRIRGEGQTVLQSGRQIFELQKTKASNLRDALAKRKRAFSLLMNKIPLQHYASQFSKKGLIRFLCGSARYWDKQTSPVLPNPFGQASEESVDLVNVRLAGEVSGSQGPIGWHACANSGKALLLPE